MKFSVLISVYSREKPEYFFRSLDSIIHQTLPPDEIVIVRDGPLNRELDTVIENFAAKAPVQVVTLKQNSGLATALSYGLLACSHEIVARMDSDDIACADRFEKQIEVLKNHPDFDLVGSNIAEFNDHLEDIVSYRKVPEHHQEILEFAHKRNPVNHMSVFFRKKAVLEAGGYIPIQGYEDYYLWVRMLVRGSVFYNIQDNLVFARVGNDMLARRQGTLFFKQEIKLQKAFLENNFINRSELIMNVLLRAIPRLLPVWMLKFIYKTLHK